MVYALAGEARIVRVERGDGATLADALTASGLPLHIADIARGTIAVGVYGETKPLDAPLADGDRIEIYRPLRVDPKEARRRRARKVRAVTGTTD